jgi:uncharacterized protein YlxP (DUF503 family)
MYVGVCRFALVVAQSHSLKEKRSVVRKLRDRVRERFQIGLVEVGGQDTWQRAELAFSVLTATRDAADAALAGVLGFVAHQGSGEIAAVKREVVGFGGDWFSDAEPWHASATGEGEGSDEWIPAAWKDEDLSRG